MPGTDLATSSNLDLFLSKSQKQHSTRKVPCHHATYCAPRSSTSYRPVVHTCSHFCACVCRRHMLLETARAQQQVPQHFDCARADSLENATCAGNRPSNTQRVEVEIPIVQSIQPSFQRPLGGATSNVPNRSAMLRAEWTITARQAVLRFAQMKY